MGEMERLKEFGFKGSKASFDESGGDINTMIGANGKTLQQMYKGGAEKLSKSGKGKISTILGVLKSGFSDAGLKLVENMKPHLDKLIPVAERISTKLPEIFDTAYEYVSQFAEPLKNAGKSIIEAGKSIFGSVQPLIKPIMESLAPAINIATFAVESIGVAFEVLSPVLEIFGGAIKALSEALNSVAEKYGGVQGMFDEAKKGWGYFFDDAKNFLNKPFDPFGINSNATGTNYFEGGLTKINERGEEMMKLPGGTKIYPHGETKNQIKQSLPNQTSMGDNVNVTINISTTGDIDEDKLGEIIYRKFKEVKAI